MKIILFVIIAAVASFAFTTQSLADGQWQFSGPFGVDVDSKGVIYVAEIKAAKITKLTDDGQSAGEIRTIEGYGDLVGPFDVSVGPNDWLYITDTLAHRVLVLDADEKLQFVLGSGEQNAKLGDFGEPHFVEVNADGEIFVSDTFNARIQKFSADGKFIKSWGKAGSNPGEFLFNGYVGQLALDGQGFVYVRECDGGRIQKYTEDGEYVATFAERGTSEGQLDEGYGCVVVGDKLVCVDTFQSRIQFFSLDGEFLDIWSPGEGNGGEHFNHPVGFTSLNDGNYVVTDWKNNRVLKMSPNGEFLEAWGKTLTDLLAWQPPVVHARPDRGPVKIGVYAGVDDRTMTLCQENGIAFIYPSLNAQWGHWPIDGVAQKAESMGLRIHPSIACLSFGQGDPSAFNEAHPELRMWKKGATGPVGATLSWAQPEARHRRAQHIAAEAKRTGVQGLLLDYIRYRGTDYGYDPIAVEGFLKEYGINPLELDQTDPRWTQYRANFITDFIYELRRELAIQIPDRHVSISVFLVAGSIRAEKGKHLAAKMQDWPTWAKAGLVDQLNVAIYSRDFDDIYNSVQKIRAQVPDRVAINAFIACYGGNLNTPELLRKGFEAAIAGGADQVTVYRSDVIYEQNLWGTIGEITAEMQAIE